MDETLGELIVRISADISNLKEGLAQAQQSIVEFADNGMQRITKAQTDFGNSVSAVGKNLESFGSGIRSLGRELNQLSGIFALAGGVGMGPFVLALHASDKYIPQVTASLRQLSDVGQVFYENLARAIIPTINRLSESLNGVLNLFLSIPKAVRENIAQNILWNSAMLVGVGILLKITAEVVRFTSDVARLSGRFIEWIGIMISTNPIMLAIALAIGVLIALMFKFEDVGRFVMNTFQILFMTLQNGFLTIAGTIQKVLASLYSALAKVYEFMSKLPGLIGAQFDVLAEGAQNLSRVLDNMSQRSMQGVINNAKKMGDILKTGTSEWSQDFKSFKKTIEDVFASFKTGSDDFIKSHKMMQIVTDGTSKVLGTLGGALAGAAAVNKKFAEAAKVTALAMAVINTAQGVTRTLAEYPFPFNVIFAAVVAAAGAIQIATIQSQQFSEGTDTVPAMLSPGEMVIPRSFSDAIRQGDLSLSGKNGSNQDVNVSVVVNAKIDKTIDIDTLGRMIGLNIEQKLRRIK